MFTPLGLPNYLAPKTSTQTDAGLAADAPVEPEMAPKADSVTASATPDQSETNTGGGGANPTPDNQTALVVASALRPTVAGAVTQEAPRQDMALEESADAARADALAEQDEQRPDMSLGIQSDAPQAESVTAEPDERMAAADSDMAARRREADYGFVAGMTAARDPEQPTLDKAA